MSGPSLPDDELGRLRTAYDELTRRLATLTAAHADGVATELDTRDERVWLQKVIEERESRIAELESEAADREGLLKERDATILELQGNLEKLEAAIKEERAWLQARIAEQERLAEERGGELDQLRAKRSKKAK
jgi:predicted  nucleic acid-binding Zn-ribbon protein